MKLRFEWDPSKAAANRRKHHVGFEEASTVFRDPLAAIFDDPEHSTDEARELIIGYATTGRLLVVSFAETSSECVRIISARESTKRERKDHEENRRR